MNSSLFDLKLGSIDENIPSVTIRFWSENKIELIVRNIKYFYKDSEFDRPIPQYYSIKLENSYRKIEFHDFCKNIQKYTTITFIVVVHELKKQFAVSISLNGDTPKFKEMIYEGNPLG